MIVAIIAGGSGSRLWPLSTHNYPKQLLKINGEKNSLLQNTYKRAKLLSDSIYVLPETRLVDQVKEQLPELTEETLIVEPALRGTASGVAAVLAHIAERHDPNEPVAILWADHYIRDTEGFVHSFQIGANMSQREGRIVLVGVEPTYPATGFGYIKKNGLVDEDSYIYNVESFKEKPAFDLAQQYFATGNYLWNAGYAIATISTFEREMSKHAPHLFDSYKRLRAAQTSEEYNEVYLALESNTIDRALTEKVEDLLVVPATFDWVDLGSFSDLSKVVISDEKGNYSYGNVETEEVQNSFIHNDEDKPIAVIGLDNIVVVNTPEGILVAPKDMSQKVGDISKRFRTE